MPFQDFKLQFLRMSYSWCVVLNGFSFVDFVDSIVDERLRA